MLAGFPSVDRLPYPIARTLADLEVEVDPNRRFRALIRTFVSTLKYCSLLLVSDYINGPMESETINRELRAHLERPSLGQWNGFIRAILSTQPTEVLPPFAVALRDFYFRAGTQHITTNVLTIDRFINLRNEHIHPGIELENDEARRICDEKMPLLGRLLDSLSFLERFPLVGKRTDSDVVRVYQGPSAEAFRSIETGQERLLSTIRPGALHLSDSSFSRTWELHPFVILARLEGDPPSELLLYETLRGQTAKYLLANRYAFDTEEYARSLRDLLRRLAQSDADRARRELAISEAIARGSEQRPDWATVRLLAHAWTLATTAPLLGKKYIDALYVRRASVESAVASFLASERRGLVIVGASGTGKTNIACRIVLDAEREGHILLFLHGGDHQGQNLAEAIPHEPFLHQRCSLPELLSSLDQAARESGRKFIIFVDAVNEAASPVSLCRQLVELASSLPRPWFKVILTCRSVVWTRLQSLLRFPPDLFWTGKSETGAERPWITLDRFDAREVEEAFERYTSFFDLEGDFEELCPETTAMMSDPFMLRLIAGVYDNRERPASQRRRVPARVWTEELFRRFVDEKTTHLDIRLLEALTNAMLAQHNATLTAEQIKGNEELQEYVYEDPVYRREATYACRTPGCAGPRAGIEPDPQSDSDCPICGRLLTTLYRDVRTTYVRLLDEGILQEMTMPDGSIGLRFGHDRLFEDHFLAEQLAKNPLTLASIRTLLDDAELFPELWGAVRSILARPVQRDLLVRLCSASAAADRTMALQSLARAGADSPEEIHGVVRRLAGASSETAREIAIKAAGLLGWPDVIRSGCLHRSAGTRAVSVIAGFEMWEGDREKGYTLLESLAGETTIWHLSRLRRNVESMLQISFMALGRHSRDPDVAAGLGSLWGGFLRPVLRPGGSIAGRVFGRLLRFTVVRAGSRVGGFIISHWKVMANDRRIRAFFDQPTERRRLMSRHASLLDPRADISGHIDALRILGETHDYLTGKLLASIVCVHTYHNPGVAVPIVRDLLETGDLFTMTRLMDGYGNQLIMNIAERPVDSGAFDLVRRHACRIWRESPGEERFVWMPMYIEGFRGEPVSSSMTELIQEALRERDVGRIRMLIADCVYASSMLDAYFGLRTLDALIDVDAPEIQAALVKGVARLRARFPDQVERCLLLSPRGRDLLKRIDQLQEAQAAADIYMTGVSSIGVAILCHFGSIRDRVAHTFEKLPEVGTVRAALELTANEALRLLD